MPNVGKSTLFNAITNSRVEAANYPFATIEPNVGIVEVRDARLKALGDLIDPEKLTYATFKFVDIAGLVKGASKGEGLGNKFLANIREVDCVCHVVRCFDAQNVTHVADRVDPVADAETIDFELIAADDETIANRIAKIARKAQSGDRDAAEELKFCEAVRAALNGGRFASAAIATPRHRALAKTYGLLTAKPTIYVANVAEAAIARPEASAHFVALKNHLLRQDPGATIVPISAKIESELSELSLAERNEMAAALGMGARSGLDTITQAAYSILGQSTFFTFGKKETRAWTFARGWKAPQCAGIIHSDFERGFIKAEVIAASDLLECGSEAKAREAGKLRLEGKDYVMQDGDVCNFKFNV